MPPFTTKDFALVAFLVARGHEYASVGQDGEEVVFSFANPAEITQALGDYASNAPVPVRSFFNSLRRVKHVIAAKKRGTPIQGNYDHTRKFHSRAR